MLFFVSLAIGCKAKKVYHYGVDQSIIPILLAIQTNIGNIDLFSHINMGGGVLGHKYNTLLFLSHSIL